MAKKVVEVVKEPKAVVEGPYILVEGVDGGEATKLDVPEPVGLERDLTVCGVRYEHCADSPDGRWIYRASR